jgi:Holliday junction resolvasome RuvABC DNA-binding subunit
MIGKLTGTLSDKNPPQVLVDCNGVGYEVQVPMSTFYNLPELGARGEFADALCGARRRANPVRL